MSGPQIWNIEQEKGREKEEVGGRPAKLNEKKGDRDLEREIKKNKQRRHFFVEQQHENIVAAVTKGEMLAATNAGENERQRKKVNETRTTFPPKNG